MARSYKTDPGYITIPEANKIMLRYLKINNKKDTFYYKTILEKAKKGEFNGRRYKKRMYQVRRGDILAYAENVRREEQLKFM